MALHEAAALFGRERDGGVLHPQRAGDLALQKFRIAGARAIGQRRPKHREAQIAVKELGVRGLSNAVPPDEIVEIGGVIAGELLAQVAWGRIIGHAWQARMVRGQIEQSDFESLRRRGARPEAADRGPDREGPVPFVRPFAPAAGR